MILDIIIKDIKEGDIIEMFILKNYKQYDNPNNEVPKSILDNVVGYIESDLDIYIEYKK